MKGALASLAVLSAVSILVGCGSSSNGPSGSSGASGTTQGSGGSGGAGGTTANAQGGQAGAHTSGGTSGTGTGGGSGGSAGSGGSGGNAGNTAGTAGSDAGSSSLNPYAGPGTMCYGGVQCPAGQFCCEDVVSDSGCIANAASCGCATPGACIVLQCDEPSDCQTGVCCATRSQGGQPKDEFSSVSCKPSCGVNDYQVCAKNSDCQSGECGPSSRAGLFHCF